MKTLLNHLALNYEECGTPKGLPLVFIHGFPFSHAMWKPQMNVIPNHVHAISYDVRGHGTSDAGDGQFTIELFVDDLIALLDYLSVGQAILCGLSMGGYIALRAVERHPDRVRGLILCDTKSEPDTNAAKIKRTATMKQVQTDGVASFAENFVKTVFWEETFERNPGAVTVIQQLICANSPLGICGTLLALASRTDTTPVLSSLNIPTCIIVGEHDKLTPPSDAQMMHTKIAGSELHILPHAAHMSNLENTPKFNECLLAFLQKQ